MIRRIEHWHETNQRYLGVALSLLAGRIAGDVADSGLTALETERAGMDAPPALEQVTEAFSLSPFERDVLLLTAGIELDAGFANRCTELGALRSGGVSFSFALSRLQGAHWSALAPSGPLRRWRLAEFTDPESPARATVRSDERVLHHLLGISFPDPRLDGFVQPVAVPDELPPTHEAVSEQVESLLSPNGDALPLIHLCGGDRAAGKAIAAMACSRAGLQLYAMRAIDIPQAVAERTALSRLWEREAALDGCALVIEANDGDPEAPLEAFLVSTRGLFVLLGTRGARVDRTVLRCDFGLPTHAERVQAWDEALGSAAARLNGGVGRIASQFRMTVEEVRDVAAQAVHSSTGLGSSELERKLWQSCRARSRRGLDRLAQRIEPRAEWRHLVASDDLMATLRAIAVQVRQQAKVYEDWGFAKQSGRGLGITALFAGPSGTGKTLAAEVIANDLSLDLYRIDLSQVVSKYIGETEKNLRAVFEAAEDGAAVLLFDEADALFGKRGEVKDSHDRYANIEVSYLLQRMEEYRGLAILTTNQKDALDRAFLRRIRFAATFPFPDAEQRAEIWRRIFPPETPVENLDVRKLARLNVTGGNIRNIALNGAFLAAEANEPVRMKHLLEAARAEYTKLERPLTQTEAGGWL
jgi:hypothetical protein